MEGWVKTHRKIQSHWLYTEKRVFSNFEAWIDIILNVNHCEAKVFIKGILFEVKRGESINSLDTWSKRWNWNKSKVRRFLDLLQKDKMIVLKSEQITTRLTVCNYDSYQDTRNADETQTKRKRNARETLTTPNKNEKNENNENKFNIKNIKSKGLDFSGFNNELIFQIWCDWLNFKYIQFKDEYKQLQSEQTALNKLKKLSKGSSEESKLIIEQSISNLWKGLFELKTTQQPQNPKQIDIIAELGLKPR
jgi:hypothetical protein